MKTVTIEITEDEAKILPLLRGVRLDVTVENAHQAMRIKMLTEGLLRKVGEAFNPPEPKATSEPTT